jgi:hypothetical protein
MDRRSCILGSVALAGAPALPLYAEDEGKSPERFAPSGGGSGSFPTGTASFAITASETTPHPGEAIVLDVNSFSGLPRGRDQLDVVTSWNFDDDGATFNISTSGKLRSTDANVANGMTPGKAWDTTGAKTVTATNYYRDPSDGLIYQNTQTIEITVTEPTWDNIAYVSYANDFTGLPPAGGNITHINSHAGLDRWINATVGTGETCVMYFRDDETFTFTNRIIVRRDGNIFAVRRTNDGTTRPVFSATGGDINNGLFTVDFNTRFSVNDITWTGPYDPVTGGGAHITAIGSEGSRANGEDVHISLANCRFSGWWINVSGPNFATTAATDTFAIYNTEIADWGNCGIFFGGQTTTVGMFGTTIMQSPRAMLKDGSLFSNPEAPDLGAIRCDSVVLCGFDNCVFANTTGWTQVSDYFNIQPAVRIDPLNSQAPLRGSATRCDMIAPQMISFDEIAGVKITVKPTGFYVDGCRLFGIRQWFAIAVSRIADVRFRNTLVYYPNISDGEAELTLGFTLVDAANDATINTGAGRPEFRYQTLVSDRSSTSGGTNSFSIVNTGFINGWTGDTANIDGSVVYIPNHSNAGSFTDYTPLSRGDDFQHTTASAANQNISDMSDVPVLDVLGNFRDGSTTSSGAYDAGVASAASVSAPSNSSVPTIAELSTFANWYYITSLGTWANLDSRYGEYMFEPDWRLDAVNEATHQMLFDNSGGAGTGSDLDVEIVYTNLGGTRVSANSADTAL